MLVGVHVLAHTCAEWCRLSCVMWQSLGEVEHNSALRSYFSSHTVNKCLFSGIFSAAFLALLCVFSVLLSKKLPVIEQ